MSVSGLTCNPTRISLSVVQPRGSSSKCGLFSSSICNGSPKEKKKCLSQMCRRFSTSLIYRDPVRRPCKIKSRVYAAFGDTADESTDIFPRINIRDPYNRLGISREASEEEIQAARNFLINKYAGHQPSVDAIESAHDKIIMQSFYDRKNPKINFKKKVREVTQSRVVKVVSSRFETPATNVITKTTLAFLVLGVLTILFPTDEGPTLQVAISLPVTIYFLYARLKNKLWAFLYGVGSFLGSWLLATFLMVSVIPPLLKGPRSLEVTSSLVSYILLWVSSTYLK